MQPEPQIQQTKSLLLTTPDALDYVLSRGIGRDAIDVYGLGLMEHSPYAQFGNRILFPILSESGDFITWQGRLWNEEAASGRPKYYHGSYSKSEVIWGLYQARIPAAMSEWIFVVEGPIDAIILTMLGFPAVATLGTALTRKMALSLKKYTDKVFLMFDDDSAGDRATDVAITVLADLGFQSRPVSLPQYKDPSDFMADYGQENLVSELERIVNDGFDKHLAFMH